jgi:hypothetical protein
VVGSIHLWLPGKAEKDLLTYFQRPFCVPEDAYEDEEDAEA